MESCVLSENIYNKSDKIMTNYSKQIEERINNLPDDNNVFVVSDFVDVCSKHTVNRILLRLIDKNVVQKVIRGVYCKPRFIESILEYALPDPILVAKAIARNNGWTIAPFGETALNILGISTQIPATYCFVTDGMYKKHSYGSIRIVFKHTAIKNISNISFTTALLIQAIKAIGKTNISENILSRLKDNYSSTQKEMILQEAKIASSWIYESIKKICKK